MAPVETFRMPIATATDWIEIGYNAVCVVLGLPVNLLTLKWLLERQRRQQQQQRSPTVWLHVNLNLSDLFVLVFYCFGRFCWLITYRWYGGEWLCKAMRFAESLSFSISSNTLVCIAINRLYLLQKPLQAPAMMVKRIPRCLFIAWIAAILCSVPQLIVWETYTVPVANWTQCLNIWVKAIEQQRSAYERNSSDVFYQPHMDAVSRIYELYHLLAISWLPLVVLGVFYALIIREVYSGEKQQQAFDARYCATNESRTASIRSGSKEPSMVHDQEERVVLRRNPTSNARIRKTKLRTLRVTLVLMAVYILCWLPYNSLAGWALIDRGSYQTHENTLYLLHGLVVFNSVINPFIYGRMHFFRKHLCTWWLHRRRRAIF